MHKYPKNFTFFLFRSKMNETKKLLIFIIRIFVESESKLNYSGQIGE